MIDLKDYEYLYTQGVRFQISKHTVDKVVAFYIAIASGAMSLPMSQEETENALMHDYLLPSMDLMIQYPEFIPIAVAYAATQGHVISTDKEVSIFEVR